MAMETISLWKVAEPVHVSEIGVVEPVHVGELGLGCEKAVVVQAVKKKWAKVILTKEEVDRVLSISICNRPFPTLTEEQLSALKSVKGLEYSDKIREHFKRGAELYHNVSQSVLHGRENMLKQLNDKGYIERVVLVDATDDGDVPVDGATNDGDAPVCGATDDAGYLFPAVLTETTHSAKVNI